MFNLANLAHSITIEMDIRLRMGEIAFEVNGYLYDVIY
jgi:hypothetical protein